MACFDVGHATAPGRRIRQGIRSLAPFRQDVLFPEGFTAAVSAAVVQQWEALPAYDRLHMCAVAADLGRLGCTADTILAGLLHDIGKPVRASTLARSLHVVLNRMAPNASSFLRSGNYQVPGSRSLHALMMHAEAGAEFLAAHHVPNRVVWLVRHHHVSMPDRDLQLLRAADDRH